MLREALLGYFGEKYPAPCLNCDNCSRTVSAWDGTVAAQKALSCVYRTGQRFGAAHLADVLIGNPNRRILNLRHDRIKTFGAGSELSKQEWRSVFRQLLAAGMLSVNIGKISGFRLTQKSWPVLRGERKVRLRKDPRPTVSKGNIWILDYPAIIVYGIKAAPGRKWGARWNPAIKSPFTRRNQWQTKKRTWRVPGSAAMMT